MNLPPIPDPNCILCGGTGKHGEFIAGLPPDSYVPKMIPCANCMQLLGQRPMKLPPIPETTPLTRPAPQPMWTTPVKQTDISLRDWLAGMAMQALVSSGRYDWGCKSYADESYSMADEMIKAREQK